MKFVTLLVTTITGAVIAMSLVRLAGWPYWSYFVICGALGLIAYVVSSLLIGRYIEARAPEFASTELIGPDTQAWELTAGTGIVPKWVSMIGVAGMGFFLAIPFELVACAVRK